MFFDKRDSLLPERGGDKENEIKENFSLKTVLRYVLYAVCLVGIIIDIIFLIIDGSDQTFVQGCFILVPLGSCIGLLDLFDYEGFCIWGAALCYIAGVGFHLLEALQSVSDMWNGVNFIGGNQESAIAFGCCFIEITIVLIVLNFLNGKKIM